MTFPQALFVMLYLPSLAALACLGVGLLVFERTRLAGRRLLYVALSNVPALVISGTVAVAVLAAMAVFWLFTHAWAPEILMGLVFDAGFGLIFLVIVVSLLASARIGWRMASGLALREAISGDHLWSRFVRRKHLSADA